MEAVVSQLKLLNWLHHETKQKAPLFHAFRIMESKHMSMIEYTWNSWKLNCCLDGWMYQYSLPCILSLELLMKWNKLLQPDLVSKELLVSKYCFADGVLGLFIRRDAFCRRVKDFLFSPDVRKRSLDCKIASALHLSYNCSVSLFLSRQKARGSHFSSKICS